MTTVQQIIEASYTRSTANDPGKLATDGELLSLANRLYQIYAALKATASPESWMSRIALPALAGAPASTALPVDIIDIRRVQTANGAKVTVFPLEEIDKGWHLAPAVYRLGGALVSRGSQNVPGGSDPVDGDVLTMFLLDSPTPLNALASVLDARYPVRYEPLLIDEIALYLSTKDPNRNADEFTKLEKSRDNMRAAFFQLCGLSTTALSTPHGGVIVQKLNAAIDAMRGGQG